MNIYEARRSAAGTLDGNLASCERDGLFREDEEQFLMFLDSAKIRGIPAIGRVAGVVTDSTVPGSDEHLDLWEGAA